MRQNRSSQSRRPGGAAAVAVVAAVAAVAALASACGGSSARQTAAGEQPATRAARSAPGETASSLAGEREGLVVVPGEGTVDTIVDRIRRTVETGGGIVSVVDHAEAARKADLDLPPTTLLLIGNPLVGTPLMQEARTVGIDLPLKILVWEEGDGRVQVAYNDPAFLARRHGITGQDDRLAGIAATLQRLATGAGENSLPDTP